MAIFSQRFGFPKANTEPDIDMSRTGGNPLDILKTFIAMQMGPADATAPINGPRPPRRLASQQPTIPIQTAQGAPQSQAQQYQTASNSGMIGASPYSNQALTGGSGMPIGGLPTQSPAPDFSSPQQVNPQQMQQPPIAGPANPQFRLQQQQLNMQNFAKLLAKLHGYNFFNRGQA